MPVPIIVNCNYRTMWCDGHDRRHRYGYWILDMRHRHWIECGCGKQKLQPNQQMQMQIAEKRWACCANLLGLPTSVNVEWSPSWPDWLSSLDSQLLGFSAPHGPCRPLAITCSSRPVRVERWQINLTAAPICMATWPASKMMLMMTAQEKIRSSTWSITQIVLFGPDPKLLALMLKIFTLEGSPNGTCSTANYPFSLSISNNNVKYISSVKIWFI